jgi:hypothetical protein
MKRHHAAGDQPRAFPEQKTNDGENTLRPRDPPENRRAIQLILIVAQPTMLHLPARSGNSSRTCADNSTCVGLLFVEPPHVKRFVIQAKGAEPAAWSADQE